MSSFNVEPDMTRASIIDEKVTALLAGRAPAEGDELASDLAWMIEQVDNVYPLPVVSEQVEDTHLVRMMEAARALPMPVTAPIPLVQTSPFDRLRAGLARKVAAATLTLTAAFGGAAYAGVLPAPVQEAVSNAAALVGLELPNPFDDDADQDSAELEGVGDDDEPSDDAVDSGPSGSGSDIGYGSDDGLESDGDDSDQEGDGRTGNGAASGDDSDEPDSDEPDSDEPDSDEPDSDEPDSDEPDSDEPDDGVEPDSNGADGEDSSDTEDADSDNPDEVVGSTDSGFGLDDESASDL